MGFKHALRRDDERRAVVAVEVGPALGRNLGGVDLHLCFGVFRKQRVEAFE